MRGRAERERDRGMTYIWPTGRRVELLIQFALKHSLRFISFPTLSSTISRLPFFFSLSSRHLSQIQPLRFRFEFIYREALFRRCCAPLPSPPPPPVSFQTLIRENQSRESTSGPNNPERLLKTKKLIHRVISSGATRHLLRKQFALSRPITI